MLKYIIALNCWLKNSCRIQYTWYIISNCLTMGKFFKERVIMQKILIVGCCIALNGDQFALIINGSKETSKSDILCLYYIMILPLYILLVEKAYSRCMHNKKILTHKNILKEKDINLVVIIWNFIRLINGSISFIFFEMKVSYWLFLEGLF